MEFCQEIRPLRRSGDGPLSHGFAVPALPEGEPRALRTVLAPRIYEGGGPRSGRGSPPAAAAGKASSVTASPCQLPQRGSQGGCAPFLPPAFMRGEGHAVAGGVPRRSGESLLSHASRASSPKGRAKGAALRSCPRIYEGGGPRSGRGSPPAAAGTALSVALRVPALPKGEPRELRTVLAPRIYEGGGPRSGRGSPPPQRRGKPPQSRLRRASSPRGEAEGAAHRSCPPHL